MSVIIETSLGDITVDLYCDACPLAARNFLKLCKAKFYNYCIFHNVRQGHAATGTVTQHTFVYCRFKKIC